MAPRPDIGGVDFDKLVRHLDATTKKMDEQYKFLDEEESFNRIFDRGQAEFNQRMEPFEKHDELLINKLKTSIKIVLLGFLVGIIICFSMLINAMFFHMPKKVSSDIKTSSLPAIEEIVQPNSLKKL